MPPVTMTDMLEAARRGGYAVGAFNILDYASMQAVIDAASRLGAPVIVQTSVRTVVYWGAEAIAEWYRHLTGAANAGVALHLDHCGDRALIGECIDAGWTSVMYDGSRLPFPDNLAASEEIAHTARSRGVSIEVELGAIGCADDTAGPLADPDEAERLCRSVRPDCFAPAVGTAHGVYRGTPVVDFALIADIARRTGIPLALHGGTGLDDGTVRQAVAGGCAKVNISTRIKQAFHEGFAGYLAAHPDEGDPLATLAAQRDAVTAVVERYVCLLGSCGRARD